MKRFTVSAGGFRVVSNRPSIILIVADAMRGKGLRPEVEGCSSAELCTDPPSWGALMRTRGETVVMESPDIPPFIISKIVTGDMSVVGFLVP
ncbi:hypothetical protein KJ925_03955 [Patescibacteria group bacterium]|nr:hypothetical protein [Patescibacteria group bacterium]